MTLELTIRETTAKLVSFQERPHPELISEWDLAAHVGALDEKLEDALITARVQKSLLHLVKERLNADLSWASRMKRETEWKWLNQLLAAARLKQLASVRIVRKSRKSGMGFDISELAASFYGKQILAGLQFAGRKVVDKGEFEQVRAACAKIKLKLPESIEPTRTERFFVEDAAEAKNEEEK